MSVFDDAVILGQKLRDTKEFQAMKQAEALMMKDQTAKQLYKRYQDLQKAYQRLQQMGKEITMENMQKLMSLEQDMMRNSLVKAYVDKRGVFMQVLKQIDQNISQGLSGQQKEGCNT